MPSNQLRTVVSRAGVEQRSCECYAVVKGMRPADSFGLEHPNGLIFAQKDSAVLLVRDPGDNV